MKLLGIAAAVVLAGGVAAAQPRSKSITDAATAYAEGQRLYLAEDYVGAARQFELAHGLDPDPAYLFNIAQAYRFARHCAKAGAYYRRFLAEVPQAPNAAAVQRYLREVDACAEPPAKLEVTAAPRDLVTPSEPPRDDGRTRRRLGLAGVGVGALGVASGILFTVRVGDRERERASVCSGDDCQWTAARQVEADELDRRGKRDSALAIASFAVGGAALAGGIVLYMLGRTTETSSLAVTPAPGGVTASFGWSF